MKTTDGLPVAFHDFKTDQFPFRVRMIDMDTNEVVHEVVVRGIGALHVPGFAPRRIKAEITFPSGMQYESGPDGYHEERMISPVPYF